MRRLKSLGHVSPGGDLYITGLYTYSGRPTCAGCCPLERLDHADKRQGDFDKLICNRMTHAFAARCL